MRTFPRQPHPPRTSTRRHSARAMVASLLLVLSAAAHAHTDAAASGGFIAGFLHPLAGFDHLLAMIAVGIWGAALGSPLIWALPVAFPLLMVVGGILGIAGVPLPFVETGIALSVLVLGLAIVAAWRAPVAVAVVLVAFFGVLHGHAHGTELPGSASPAAYAAGFVISTGLLHLAGIALGALRSVPRGPLMVRAAGGLIALAGVWILVGSPGAA